MTNDSPLTASEIATLSAAGYTPWGGEVEGDRIVVKFAKDGDLFSATRAEWRTTITELSKTPTEDEVAFGKDAWVYCSQHMKPHLTGWCSVAVRDKVGLGVSTATQAYEKCREWKFALHAEPQE